ncbi:axin interactor, dorsalization-associated protein isoform X4 [Hydra vulgaris]|uniref:Axin interactor, dorsalization-associated protein isoform X4 n=1 Tax=Hydra vulgaris TaxID=6087 RepID=A0ABM4CFT0_HYDVU
MLHQKVIFDTWKKDFMIATQFDRANETANAIATYKLILNGIAKFVDGGNSCSSQHKETANKIMHCIKNRVVVLSKSNEQEWPSLEEILKLQPVLNNFYKWKKVFPVLIITENTLETNSVASIEFEPMKELQPPLEKNSLYQRFAFDLQRIGLKYPRCLLNPFLSISLRDADSVLLTPIVNTPVLKTIKDDYYYLLHYRVNVQMYLEKIPRLSAVFFELKHTFENRLETKYFTFLSHEYFKCNNVFLEIYKGPVDYHRKNLRKMTTTKPLYLHLAIKMINV